MMGSFESFCGGDESYSLDSASALPFLDPGLYVTLKEKREKNRDQRAWRGLRRLAERMYSKLRWSVSTTKGILEPSSQCRHSSNAAFIASNSRSPTS